jgi:hypothetical protein
MRKQLQQIGVALAGLVLAAGALAESARDTAPPRAAQAAEREASLSLPRGADGSIDIRAAVRAAKDAFSDGATEVQFRDRALSEHDIRNLARRLDGAVFRDLAAALPDDGIERTIRFRAGDADIRLQRNEESRLRARMDDLRLGALTAREREELARRIADQAGLDRLRLRGVDAEGRRFRVELRADRGIVRNEARDEPNERDKHERADKKEREDKHERAEKRERMDKHERAEKHERARPQRQSCTSPYRAARPAPARPKRSMRPSTAWRTRSRA